MYAEFLGEPDKLKLIDAAIRKAGSERKVEEHTGIPHGCLYNYKHLSARMPYERFDTLCKFTGIKEADLKVRFIEKKAWLSKGGKNNYLKKVKEGTFSKNLEKMKKASSRKMKRWHSVMRRGNRRLYYEIQYDRFKKIGGYKYRTNRGEAVRNAQEKHIADLLYDLRVDYKYEPYIEGKSKAHFPDFLFGKTIIESTCWKGVEKAYALAKKIKDLEGVGYKILVVVPTNLKKYYRPIDDYLISVEEIKNHI